MFNLYLYVGHLCMIENKEKSNLVSYHPKQINQSKQFKIFPKEAFKSSKHKDSNNNCLYHLSQGLLNKKFKS